MNEWDEQDWKRFEDALRDREPWELAAELELPPPDTGALRELATRLDEERTAAQALLEPLLVSLRVFEEAQVERDGRFRTRAAVDALTTAAVNWRERQPAFALVIATAAVTIATKLASVHELRPMLLGSARLERAKALFVIGKYRECEEELVRADAAFGDDPFATEWEHARVSLVRSNIYVETHRPDEAMVEARGAARTFRAFGDTALYLAARMVEGGVLVIQRSFRAAADTLDALAAEALRAGDQLHRARARQTAANCYIELREYETAAAYLFEALTLWDELGLDTERVRTNWSIGVLLLARGEVDSAIERIDQARRSFEALGVVNDAAIARLELAEALLAADRPAEVPDLLRNVVVSFTSEGIMHNARIALAYLREAVEAGAIEPRIIRHVRNYLEELPTHPTSAFTPLR
jgi:tetratricopeptide (TPR) repeat protein